MPNGQDNLFRRHGMDALASQLGATHLGKPRSDQNDRTFGIHGAERSHERW
jgi:hypothetical protein